MRPGSASRNNLNSSGGQPPGTAARPGSGRRPPATARLRTGMASGPGTMAAQGLALSANVNVSDRPMTGHGVAVKTQQGGQRLVQDAAFYIGLLRKKISDVNNETIKLRTEIDQQSKDNSQYNQLERRYDTLIKEKEALEGKLADYNLALDKTRSSTDPEDVQQMAYHMAEKNRQAGQDLDRIFSQRKQREMETGQIEDQIENIHQSIQKRINELEPNKLRAYNDLMLRQKELQDRLLQYENRLNEINNRVHHYENDDQHNQIRRDYVHLDRLYNNLKKDLDASKEELDIANLSDTKEAHNKFVNRVNNMKQSIKVLDDRIVGLKEEIAGLHKSLDDLNNQTSDSANALVDNEDIAKYELLVKRDQDMTSFIDTFEENRNKILSDTKQSQFMIVALLEHIGKGIDETTQLPNQEALVEMENAKEFKEKNLKTAQKTMENLTSERKKREKELEILRSSEPKLLKELNDLRESMVRMEEEMKIFENIESIRQEFDGTKNYLMDMKSNYIKRRDSMRSQIQSISIENDSIKKQLNNNEIARELDDTEKRLKHYERSIFELKEFVDTKSRETDYEHVKSMCLKLSDSLNSFNIKAAQQVGGAGLYNAQAKW